MRVIINLTQHSATADQLAAGVVDIGSTEKEELVKLLTFEELPSDEDVEKRAHAIADLAEGYFDRNGDPEVPQMVMIGGAPWLMSYLEGAMLAKGILPTYSFSKRVSSEVIMPEGVVTKTNMFKHVGWIDSDWDR